MPAEQPRSVRSFRGMGVDVVVGGATELELIAIRRLFASREGVFSRFLPGSELSRVNRTKAPALVVSELFAGALATALRAAAATNGLVDPTLGAAVAPAGRWRAVRLSGRLVTRLPEVGLDLSGVVKGLVVDEALALLRGEGFVSAAGDLATRGSVVVGLPQGDSVRLLGGGLATSGAGRPSPWTQVTVAAGSCLAAEVAAKAALLLGHDGPAWLDERGLPGRFVGPYGVVLANGSWNRGLGSAPAPAARLG